MYFIILFLLLTASVCLIIFHFRKKKIICKIKCMSIAEKCHILNELAKPFGYRYDVIQDIFTSRTDAWQKDYGYSVLYDKAAPFFNMVFDCFRVYFNYDGRTWLIEFWKGQYGINTGSEVGIYYTDKIISPDSYKTTWFKAADKNDYIDISSCLYYRGHLITHLRKLHWWLTTFLPGKFSKPSELSMKVVLRFKDFEMCASFINALNKACCKVSVSDLCINFMDISFIFERSNTKINPLKRIFIWYVQYKNRIFCALYRFVTRPFCSTLDRLLYLYYYLPFAFNKTAAIKHYRKRRN